MPILEKMVCESLSGAIFESLSSVAAANGGANCDEINLQDKLIASAKRMLAQTGLEYEEGPSHKLPFDALKAKYIVLKPPPPTQSPQGVGQQQVNGGGKMNGGSPTTPSKCAPSLAF